MHHEQEDHLKELRDRFSTLTPAELSAYRDQVANNKTQRPSSPALSSVSSQSSSLLPRTTINMAEVHPSPRIGHASAPNSADNQLGLSFPTSGSSGAAEDARSGYSNPSDSVRNQGPETYDDPQLANLYRASQTAQLSVRDDDPAAPRVRRRPSVSLDTYSASQRSTALAASLHTRSEANSPAQRALPIRHALRKQASHQSLPSTSVNDSFASEGSRSPSGGDWPTDSPASSTRSPLSGRERTLSNNGASGIRRNASARAAVTLSTKKRNKLSAEQKAALERYFEKNRNPIGNERARLAAEVDIPEKSLQIWFQNRRIRYPTNSRAKAAREEDALHAERRQSESSQASAHSTPATRFREVLPLGLPMDESAKPIELKAHTLVIGHSRRNNLLKFIIIPKGQHFIWWMREGSYGMKLELQWKLIDNITFEGPVEPTEAEKAEGIMEPQARIVIHLLRPPFFFKEVYSSRGPESSSGRSSWRQSDDFTDSKVATQVLDHELIGPYEDLHPVMQKLYETEPVIQSFTRFYHGNNGAPPLIRQGHGAGADHIDLQNQGHYEIDHNTGDFASASFGYDDPSQHGSYVLPVPQHSQSWSEGFPFPGNSQQPYMAHPASAPPQEVDLSYRSARFSHDPLGPSPHSSPNMNGYGYYDSTPYSEAGSISPAPEYAQLHDDPRSGRSGSLDLPTMSGLSIRTGGISNYANLYAEGGEGAAHQAGGYAPLQAPLWPSHSADAATMHFEGAASQQQFTYSPAPAPHHQLAYSAPASQAHGFRWQEQQQQHLLKPATLREDAFSGATPTLANPFGGAGAYTEPPAGATYEHHAHDDQLGLISMQE